MRRNPNCFTILRGEEWWPEALESTPPTSTFASVNFLPSTLCPATPQLRKMEFPKLHIINPQSPHTHTAILLHGRASSGPEFAEDFFSSHTSQNQSLAASLPTWRWVFPTSRDRWSTTFQEPLCAWFDAYSLGDIQARQDLQVDGLRESVAYIHSLVDSEIELLGGRMSNLYLGGISQGMATGLWTLFCSAGRIRGPLGGFLGCCGWLPFANQVEDLLGMKLHEQDEGTAGGLEMQRRVVDFFRKQIASSDPDMSGASRGLDVCVLKSPIFLSHGADDVWVSADLGRQACRVLGQARMSVQWHEFTGAEEDGHWIKEPEGFDQILQFLRETSNDQYT